MSPSYKVSLIIIAQFLGTSLWFSTNAVAPEIAELWGIDIERSTAWMTVAVQFGFITGTLLSGLTGFADRYQASRIFAVSALIGALSNYAVVLLTEQAMVVITLRFITGFALAGIYPLGMKLVVSWLPEKSGQALGWLVGMLTLGTALPHLLRGFSTSGQWQLVLISSSVLAIVAGLAVLATGDGPHTRKALTKEPFSLRSLWSNRAFKQAAWGYFGHMWELYAFWAIVPLLVVSLVSEPVHGFYSFLVIAVGAIGCVAGGRLTTLFSGKQVAAASLVLSLLMCILYPLLVKVDMPLLTLLCLLVWGFFVVSDSPQFSALSARAVDANQVGRALSLQNAVGFLLSIISIWLLSYTFNWLGAPAVWLLVPGPVLGLICMYRYR